MCPPSHSSYLAQSTPPPMHSAQASWQTEALWRAANGPAATSYPDPSSGKAAVGPLQIMCRALHATCLHKTKKLLVGSSEKVPSPVACRGPSTFSRCPPAAATGGCLERPQGKKAGLLFHRVTPRRKHKELLSACSMSPLHHYWCTSTVTVSQHSCSLAQVASELVLMTPHQGLSVTKASSLSSAPSLPSCQQISQFANKRSNKLPAQQKKHFIFFKRPF